jgi:hypothetical protein
MNLAQYIYIQKVSDQTLKMMMEKALGIAMIRSDQPEWLFYYADEKIDVSVGLRQSLSPEHFISLCKRPVKTEMGIVFRAPTNHMVACDIAAVKCVNAILNEFDTDLIFMFEDDSLRLVRCQGQVLINWSESKNEKNFWNRPEIKILDKLTIPYKKQTFELSSKEDNLK